MSDRIPITRPWLNDEDVQAAGRAILSGWVTQGPEVAAFEAEFAAFCGASHACAVSSCTTALHVALLAVGVQPEDEVITVSHSFIATANAIRHCGAVPVFVDIEPDTFNLNPEGLNSVLSSRTRAIVAVHQMGMPCDLARIIPWARQHNLPVIEDAACAVGSEICWQGQWQPIGRPHGDIACFSFHPRKLITTGDGGMLTTRAAHLDQTFRLLRQHGMSVSDTVRHQAAQVITESYNCVGYNYRLTDIQAAIGRVQLGRLPQIVSERRRLAERYQRLLAPIAGLGLPHEPAWARSNWQSYCVRLPEHCSQSDVMQGLLEHGIATRRGIMCSHREPAYHTAPWRCADKPDALRQSEQAQDHCIVLPLFGGLTDAEQDRVVEALRAV